ncbi:MAG: bifunctional 4-hydroxy-3-methylbut-2-enyl diphosphate reductase/30S ribosomal protein S1 [Oscillospiraceae bacterium]|jgi:4-hydroxy-3-methylbut-2-enyl diphosphate reductase|nr:bifunctional 4-hydroxy-3-methylbut-2-enyl diphosphate reductase/30S ribosomal protein S1 [Oscillospiraceae bacterium]
MSRGIAVPVEIGKHAGFCYGVQAAVDQAFSALRGGEVCWSLGNLIHNEQVMARLRAEGLRMAHTPDDIPAGTVIIRSHGAAPDTLDALAARGLTILDATCPNVARVHRLVQAYSQDGAPVFIAGQANHPEVSATAGWCAGAVTVLGSAEEAAKVPPVPRALLVAQTTLTQPVFAAIAQALGERVQDLSIANTICAATGVRQMEAEAMARRADVMLVVGDQKSANTRALFDTCRAHCKRVYFIGSAADLPTGEVRASDYIAITAGASTPDWSLKEVATHMIDLTQPAQNEADNQPAFTPEATPAQAPAELEAPAPVAEAPAVEAPQTPAPATEPTENSFMADIEATLVTIRTGQTIVGTVVQVTEDEVCVNIGYKSDGLVKRSDLLTTDVKEGDEIEVEVVKVNDGEGNVLLSQRNIQVRRNWDALMEQYDNGEYITAVGKEAVKGGLIANVNGIRAFIPASQLSQRYIEKIEDFVGKEMQLKIIEVDRAKRRIVCSRKMVAIEQAASRKKEIWDKLNEGEIIPGVVRRLTDFGAFVDIGGVDGLVHVTDLSWGRIHHARDVVSPNQEIMVKILSLDPERERIQLGYKQTQPRPWETAEEKYPAGIIVEGKVVRITTFGAFVELEPGLDGLVHISQCALSRIAKVEDAVQVGQIVRVKVLGVDMQAKRISLSIRAALEEEAFNYSDEIPGDDMYTEEATQVYASPAVEEPEESEAAEETEA